MDAVSARAANILLGNAENAVVIELALQGARFRVLREGWLSLAGASMGWTPGTARKVSRDEVLDFTRHESGVYAYMAAPGGWAAPEILGSPSVSARGGLGRGLVKGDVLSCQLDPSHPGWEPAAANPRPKKFPPFIVVTVWRGPQWSGFRDCARRTFFAQDWTVSSRSDRMGLRLDGAVVEAPAADMPSEPVLIGSVQITGGGQPVVTMRDGPTVGGYPKIVWLDGEACRRVAQIPPGGKVKFLPPEEE